MDLRSELVCTRNVTKSLGSSMDEHSILGKFLRIFREKRENGSSMASHEDALLFNFSTEKYNHIFEQCIASQRAYCERNGIEYQNITIPDNSIIGREIAWIKVPLILGALTAGYRYVAFVDSDIMISENSEDFRTVFLDGSGTIALSSGHSGRLNSGVIFVKNSDDSINSLEEIIQSFGEYIPACDRVGWGENGYFINQLKRSNHLIHLDRKWNNTVEISQETFFTHYTGPLREMRTAVRNSTTVAAA